MQTIDPVEVQIMDLLQSRMEDIDATTTNYYRTVKEVAVIDELPEERWIAEENIERRSDYVITLADITEAVSPGTTCTNIADWTLAVSGFFRRKRPQENPWQRKYDSDFHVRRNIKDDIIVAMNTPNDQLGMLVRQALLIDVDAIVFADAQLEQHWVAVRTIWTMQYQFGRLTPWTTS